METKYPLVLVTWEDHTGDAGWFTDESVGDLEHATATTIGWLVSKRGKSYKVADTLIDNGFGGVSVILKKTVTSIREITI